MTDMELLSNIYAIQCFVGSDISDADMITKLRELESIEPEALETMDRLANDLTSYWINSDD